MRSPRGAVAELVDTKREGDVAVIVIDNPPVNFLNNSVRTGLIEAPARARDDTASNSKRKPPLSGVCCNTGREDVGSHTVYNSAASALNVALCVNEFGGTTIVRGGYNAK